MNVRTLGYSKLRHDEIQEAYWSDLVVWMKPWMTKYGDRFSWRDTGSVRCRSFKASFYDSVYVTPEYSFREINKTPLSNCTRSKPTVLPFVIVARTHGAIEVYSFHRVHARHERLLGMNQRRDTVKSRGGRQKVFSVDCPSLQGTRDDATVTSFRGE